MTTAHDTSLREVSYREAQRVLAEAKAGPALKELKLMALDEADRRGLEASFMLIVERADEDEPGSVVVGVLTIAAGEDVRWEVWRSVDDRFGAYLGGMAVSKRRAVNRSIGFKVVVDAGHVD